LTDAEAGSMNILAGYPNRPERDFTAFRPGLILKKLFLNLFG
jgi:hypothetical protein